MSGVRLQEVPNTVIDLETFGSLVNWSFGKLVSYERWSRPEVRLCYDRKLQLCNQATSFL